MDSSEKIKQLELQKGLEYLIQQVEQLGSKSQTRKRKSTTYLTRA